MFTPTRALRRASVGGDPLPLIPGLEELGEAMRLRKGQLVMFAGQSKSGKSAIVQNIVDRWNVNGLYFSADMSARDTAARLVAMNTGLTTDEVAQALADEPTEVARFEGILNTRNTMFNFQSSPALDDIVAEISTYVDVFDEYPDVIVLDTLAKVREGEGGDYAGQTIVMDELHGLSRVTGALVIVVHHTKEATGRSVFKPPAKKDLKNMLSDLPEVIVTVAREEDIVRLAVVAHRSAPCDPTGDTYTELVSDLARCTFKKVPPVYRWDDDDEPRWDQR